MQTQLPSVQKINTPSRQGVLGVDRKALFQRRAAAGVTWAWILKSAVCASAKWSDCGGAGGVRGSTLNGCCYRYGEPTNGPIVRQ